MSEVIRIARRGKVKIEFDAEDGPVEFDVVEVFDQWYEIDWTLRDKDGILPKDKVDEHGKNRQNFVQALLNDAYTAAKTKTGKPERGAPELTRAEAQAFILAIQEEAARLRDFFSPKKEETSSSPESTGTQINFSQ